MTTLIGGRNDGKTVSVPADRHRVEMPIPHEWSGDDIFQEGALDIVTKVEFTVETYDRMQFRGSGKTFDVFVHQGLNADDVFAALIESYGKSEHAPRPVPPLFPRPPSLKPMRTEAGRVISFEVEEV